MSKKIRIDGYTAEEQERHDAAFDRLLKIIQSKTPGAAGFRRALNEELATGFPADWPYSGGWTLLHWAVSRKGSVSAGLPQILIDAGADVNATNDNGRTPLGFACWDYVGYGAPEYLTVIDALLEGRQGASRRDAAGTRNALKESLNVPTGQERSVAGAQPELDERWKADRRWHWDKPEQQARRDWLEAYIKTWYERRARDRAADAAPDFDYAL